MNKLSSIELLLVIIALFTKVLTQSISLTSCLEYAGGVCIKCDLETHLFDHICYRNILGCIQYYNGATCAQCDPQYFVISGNICSSKPGITLTPNITNSLYLYGGNATSNPGDRYGSTNFRPVTYSESSAWPSFKALNTYITKGEYSHFISRISNPVYSVHYYITDTTYSYKLLYHGSGGGLFLCIADVPASLNVLLRSLTPISNSDIIDHCIDYDLDGNCLRCENSYHLENERCYVNFGGCSKYRENICIECLDYFFLVENRCVSDCLSVSDARSVLFYGSSQTQSTLEIFYKVEITKFYSLVIKNTTSTSVVTFTANFTETQTFALNATESNVGTSSIFNPGGGIINLNGN